MSNATQLCGLVTFACKSRGKGLIVSWIQCGPSPSPCPLPEGEGKKNASASGATSWRLRAGLRPGPETDLGARTVSRVRSPNLRDRGHPKGHARAPMVLGPFAETKGSRRAGATPRKTLSPSVILANAPGSLCIVADLQPDCLTARGEKNSAMRWRRYKDRRLKTLDPFLDWIPDQSLSPARIRDRGQASRMTDKDKSKTLEP